MLILWFGWLERNDVKHRNKKFNPERIIWKVHQHIVTISKTKIAKGLNWKGDRHFAKSIGLDIGSSYKPKLKIVKWTKPEAGWIKINTDGASKGNPGVAGAGGIARNEEGAVIFAFYETLGEANNSFAEVFGLFKALQICQTEGLPRVWIEIPLVPFMVDGMRNTLKLLQRVCLCFCLCSCVCYCIDVAVSIVELVHFMHWKYLAAIPASALFCTFWPLHYCPAAAETLSHCYCTSALLLLHLELFVAANFSLMAAALSSTIHTGSFAHNPSLLSDPY
ncbi:UNVERIFIED_CONTAM: putative ribonuclease H protein [Sesamum radiatum]|uniref:Ribonuclease H protein n=1 Tax=Sesamum radiatum TaxID=300843 RepID=A0AAW2ITE7_SESRA